MRANQFIRRIKEAVGDGDVANAVVAEVIKLIGEGHTEVSPDVITTKVSASLGHPFMLKDLVAANNASPELQHYIDSINPSKIKFSTDILTVKNQDPVKEKEHSEAGVASMAARAANRNRLGESVSEGWGQGTDRVSLPDKPDTYFQGTGQLQKEYDALYAELVPSQGKADTVEGEVLRAASKIVYRHYNDGDEFNQASFDQLKPYIGHVTSYDDLAHKATMFAAAAEGEYHPNPNWDSLDVMEYGPPDEDDDYDEDDYDDADDNIAHWAEEDDEDDLREDDYEDEDQGFFVAISGEEDGVFIGMVVKEDGKWRERTYKGNPPNNWGGTYMGYLTPQDVMSWINKDYGRSYEVQGPMDEDEANEYMEYMSEGRTTWNSDWYVYNPETLAVKKKFRTYKGAKQYAEANGLKLAASEWYHDKINTQKQTDEGWESGPEERAPRERDPDDAYDDMRQQKADDEAERQQARRPQEKYYTLSGRGPNMEPNYAFPGEYATQDEAAAARAELMADPSTPNPRMIGIDQRTRYLGEGRETPLRDLEDYSAKKKALQDIQTDPHTGKDPELTTELIRRLAGLEQQRKDLK